jgi:hypothetical protein
MRAAGVCDCGRKTSPPVLDVPALDDAELVITVVRTPKQPYRDEAGVWRLAPAAFRRVDVEGKKRKSVSLMRKDFVAESDVRRRAEALNSEMAWKGDPVVAIATAADLRSISSERFSKCTCVYADPISEEAARAEKDPLGECCGHASLTKHCGFHGANDPEAWVNLISDLAERFDAPMHVATRRPVTVL